MLKPIVVVILSCLLFSEGLGQIQIGGTMTVGDNIIATNSGIINSGSVTFNTNAELILSESGVLSSSARLVVPNLTLSGINYQVEGSIFIGSNLDLLAGTLSVASTDRLGISSSATTTSQNGAHVNGRLYHEGTGNKFYPIGVTGTYTPVTLFNVQGSDDVLVGVEAFASAATVTDKPLTVKEVSTNWHWQISSEGTFNGSDVSLPLLIEDTQFTTGDNVESIVVQIDDGIVTSLGRGSGTSGTQVVSAEETIGPVVAVGSAEVIQLVIRNLITPNGDNSNDYLFIENADLIDGVKKVIFLDRWGSQIGDNIADFKNDDPELIPFFEKFQSGNYICVLILEDGRRITQPVTVLRNNQ